MFSVIVDDNYITRLIVIISRHIVLITRIIVIISRPIVLIIRIIVQLGLDFKLNTKIGLDTTHPPQTFRPLPGLLGG